MTCAPTYSARDECHHVISERLRTTRLQTKKGPSNSVACNTTGW
jgi:hypothetical protein